VNTGLTSEGVAALAPDAKVAAAGKKLGTPKFWQSLGCNQEALWGECRGSAVYQVRVDLSDLAVKCSCPSRKQPCKHVIGLLFLSLEATPSETSSPDWVTDWLARRAARKRAGASAETAPDPEAKEKRAKKQLSRVAAGLEALDLWMEDLVRGGTPPGPDGEPEQGAERIDPTLFYMSWDYVGDLAETAAAAALTGAITIDHPTDMTTPNIEGGARGQE
jgi:hypothetical protein